MLKQTAIYTCDRCGKEGSMEEMVNVNASYGVMHGFRSDLCENCKNDLEAWMKKK